MPDWEAFHLVERAPDIAGREPQRIETIIGKKATDALEIFFLVFGKLEKVSAVRFNRPGCGFDFRLPFHVIQNRPAFRQQPVEFAAILPGGLLGQRPQLAGNRTNIRQRNSRVIRKGIIIPCRRALFIILGLATTFVFLPAATRTGIISANFHAQKSTLADRQPKAQKPLRVTEVRPLKRHGVMQPHDQRGINLVQESPEPIVHQHSRMFRLRKVPQ